MTLTDMSNISPSQLSAAEQRQYKTICAALWCYYNEPQLGYGHVRGQGLKDQYKPPPYVPHEFDCSSFVTYCYIIAGARDPNPRDSGRDGQTSTATLWGGGRLLGYGDVKPKQMIPGDLCFYKHGSEGAGMQGGDFEHVTIYISKGKVVSHGSQTGPKILDYNDKGFNEPFYGARRYDF